MQVQVVGALLEIFIIAPTAIRMTSGMQEIAVFWYQDQTSLVDTSYHSTSDDALVYFSTTNDGFSAQAARWVRSNPRNIFTAPSRQFSA